jgi:CMP/dCMP kinase
MRAIIISGMPAAGKTTVAQILGKKFGIRVVGMGDVLKEMAKEEGYAVTAEDWWDTPDGIKFLKEREANQDFDKEADTRLIELISGGDIVITSWTAPWLSKDGFKVWLGAKLENRAARMAKRDNTDIKEATRTTKVRDEENYKLYKRLYHFELGRDLSVFDLIVDTDSITPEQVAEVIIKNTKNKL